MGGAADRQTGQTREETMSPRDAPLYIRTRDLVEWLLSRILSWERAPREMLGRPLFEAGEMLLDAIALALVMPDSRPAHQEVADRAIVCVRELLRLSAGQTLLSRRQLRFALEELDVMGRMLGGWRKRVNRRGRRRKGHETASGDEP